MIGGSPAFTTLPSRLVPEAPGGARPPGGRAFALEATRTRDLELSITTDQGDTVTISMHAERDTLIAGYRGLAHGHRRAAGALAATRVERDVSMSVQGDLNAQERADIAALVDRVTGAARDFYDQHLDTARSMMATFGDLDSLQSFTATASQQESVTMVSVAGTGRTALPQPVAPDPAAGEGKVC